MPLFRDAKIRRSADVVEIIRMKIWRVIIVWEGNEKKIVEKLGVDDCYIPRLTKWVRKRRRKKGGPARERREYPLMPGFIFYSGDIDADRVGWLRSDRKVIGVLGFAGRLGVVHDYEIDRLKSAEMGGDYDETRKLFSGIVGNDFEIVRGSFAGKIAHVRDFEKGSFVLEFPGLVHAVRISVSNFDEIAERGS